MYKNKYLKYKIKYLNLIKQKGGGGGWVPFNLPDTQSWFFMPVLLRPFKDIQIDFPNEFLDESNNLKSTYHNYNLNEINDILIQYYNSNNLDLNNRRELTKLGLIFDDLPYYKHLSQHFQEKILNDLDIKYSLDVITQSIINKYKNWKFNFFSKDNVWINVQDIFTSMYKQVKIHIINKYNKNLYEITNNKDYKESNNKYFIYLENDVIIREAVDNTKIVLIVFGHWGDSFELFYNLNKSSNGLIIYFNDRMNKWYSEKMGLFISIIKKYANSYEKYAFIGASMGGYGSLYSSLLFPDKKCITISLVPNIKNLANSNNIIFDTRDSTITPKINQFNEIKYNILDLLEEKNYNTKIYTIIGRSECNDFGIKNLSMDHFNIGMIINYPNVSTIIYNKDTHLIACHVKFNTIYDIILREFDNLYDDPVNGRKILFDNIEIK
jgi:hypothetical protein